jgi:hypothetical protein
MTDIRIGIDPEDHHDLLVMNLDALDQCTDEVLLITPPTPVYAATGVR